MVDQRGHSRREMLVQRGEWQRVEQWAEKVVNNNEGRRSYSRFSCSGWSWSPLETAAAYGHAGVVQVVVHVLSVMVLVQVP